MKTLAAIALCMVLTGCGSTIFSSDETHRENCIRDGGHFTVVGGEGMCTVKGRVTDTWREEE